MVKQVSRGSPLLVKHTACNAEQFPQLLLRTVLTKEILHDVTAQNEMCLTLLTRSRTLLPSGQGIPSADSYKMVSFINLGKNQRIIQSIIYYHWQEKTGYPVLFHLHEATGTTISEFLDIQRLSNNKLAILRVPKPDKYHKSWTTQLLKHQSW